MPVVALVGYTNAGKSTLLNKLSNADIYVADQLFATLDPTTRRVELPGGRPVLFTDTVGFIQKLPTSLIASFRATLEEIADADLLLHVIDISHNNAIAQAEAVHETLIEIEADNIPVISILNKIDLLIDPEGARNTLIAFPQSVAISALTGEGIQELLNAVEGNLYSSNRTISVRLPYQQGGLISLFHDVGQVERIEHGESEVFIRGEIPFRFLSKLQPYLVNESI
jgi:GTP-binding protein HflX